MFKEFFSDREPDIILQPYETLFNHMQPADCAYVIQDGSIELFISDEQIATIEKDDLLGEMALFEGGYRSATAQAGGEGAVLFKLLTGEFMDFIAERPDFAFKVMQRTTERLREMDTRTMQYKYAVASMKDGVLVIDQEGLILSVNDSAMQILGIVSADEFENRMLGEAFANLRYAENEEFIASLETSLSIKDYVDNKVVKFANGSIQSTLSLTTSELFDSDNDDMSGIIAVFRDISELQELREKEIALGKEVKRRHDELARAYMSIEESNSEMESTLKRVSSM
ncbi:MAG: PAS domain S-box protein, partial [Nitrospinota bacterium]|nr:PAS domain S-box protein [Nitrospinota bacterium]